MKGRQPPREELVYPSTEMLKRLGNADTTTRSALLHVKQQG
ncbi:hypothetical protein L798_06916 [Zootermopsis nevadensis]|uniref:Uncharacterized protein n=1 Tax=Zootermopsis nevadensis TaxID=136037 RepID=A0A067R4K0_ZOONE|nr:hypothetical protein L798_06916 [Zootermopsis nevadensis]